MSIISSKQPKKHGLVDSIFVFVVLILVLLVVVPSNASIGNSLNITFRGPATRSVPSNSDLSFTADLQYWNANCNYGWSSDATCANINARAQSCTAGVDSAYCTEYNKYLQQYFDK